MTQALKSDFFQPWAGPGSPIWKPVGIYIYLHSCIVDLSADTQTASKFVLAGYRQTHRSPCGEVWLWAQHTWAWRLLPAHLSRFQPFQAPLLLREITKTKLWILHRACVLGMLNNDPFTWGSWRSRNRGSGLHFLCVMKMETERRKKGGKEERVRRESGIDKQVNIPASRPWLSYLTSLRLGFFIYKRGIVTPTLI